MSVQFQAGSKSGEFEKFFAPDAIAAIDTSPDDICVVYHPAGERFSSRPVVTDDTSVCFLHLWPVETKGLSDTRGSDHRHVYYRVWPGTLGSTSYELGAVGQTKFESKKTNHVQNRTNLLGAIKATIDDQIHALKLVQLCTQLKQAVSADVTTPVALINQLVQGSFDASDVTAAHTGSTASVLLHAIDQAANDLGITFDYLNKKK